ncbi:hypothetical protein AU106_gp106 [Sinorhizobium phage phiM9]|uniref:Uncharacterized protein n=1 Tax=Sinorhizobium phage phiM9 TaxID=1636182 RepID=A0A0F6R502_9CAUD|nr:hypothetical protein AU106_gp106 [Sinorhizobium phage phiM9]AKE44737.1 hypothetical protein Sm_phiM9_109 [Sinorhizobium phage phiM9]
MTISELISVLEAVKKDYGDVDVIVDWPYVEGGEELVDSVTVAQDMSKGGEIVAVLEVF